MRWRVEVTRALARFSYYNRFSYYDVWSTLASWGVLGRSLDDPGTLGSSRKDTVRSRLGFYRVLIDLGDPFREIFGYMRTEKHDFFHIYFRVAFSDDFGV